MRCICFRNIIELDEIDSTNKYVKTSAEKLPEGTVVFSDEQTAGRGRMDRLWYGKKGKSIFASFLIKNIYDNLDAVRLSFLFSIALKTFFSKYISYERIRLKWPNDVLIDNKKISGILSEYSKECVIVGIGINVSDFEPDGDIEKPWTTIQTESGTEPDMNALRSELTEAVNGVFMRYCTNQLTDFPKIWFREADIRDNTVTVDSGGNSFTGRVKMIDDNGALVVEDSSNGEIKTVYYGDITINDQF
ncbi:MAG: biotin--[acetyl-CoA-carboxylase] ligase [Candidatus Delongbacteria bacterium]|nr:biotin--[acetyl-CoA-carboxylase] ligase [Candidatus Delongbacteria bacterium]